MFWRIELCSTKGLERRTQRERGEVRQQTRLHTRFVRAYLRHTLSVDESYRIEDLGENRLGRVLRKRGVVEELAARVPGRDLVQSCVVSHRFDQLLHAIMAAAARLATLKQLQRCHLLNRILFRGAQQGGRSIICMRVCVSFSIVVVCV